MAFFSCWAWVLVGCFYVSFVEASDLPSVLPPLWDDTPEDLIEYQDENGTYVIDPWVYTQRMGMYKILLKNTSIYFQSDGSENILWGLPLQHGWQYHSGRLVDPTRRTSCGSGPNNLCISENSWWADLNYFLCALPFLAAVDSDIMGIKPDQVKLLPPLTDQDKFCLTVSSCQLSYRDTMKKWNVFYQSLKSPKRKFDDLVVKLWDAHTSTLDATEKTFEDRLDNYAVPEATFGRTWVVVVNYLASYGFQTDLPTVVEFQSGLPPRMLKTDDKSPFITDFTDFQNIVLFLLDLLYKIDSSVGSSLLTLWKFILKLPGVKSLIGVIVEKFLELYT